MVQTTNYNAMTETSKLKKYLMWYKVKELFSTGLNKTQIGQSLCLHRQTVAKYLSLTEEEFIYVKYNFLRGREFVGIDLLNKEVWGWLERTANGTEHHGIRRVPSEEFETEKSYLMPYKGVPTAPCENLLPHHVRKDNVITYRGNYYSVPTGTYHGHQTLVYIEEKEGRLHVYSHETGKPLAVHKISGDKGHLVSNTSHRRDREASLDDYETSVRKVLPASTVIDTYLSQLRVHKARNYRDNLQFIVRRHAAYSDTTLTEAFVGCLEAGVFNGCSLMEVAE